MVNKGESYLYTDGKWRDMTDMIDSLTDRAYKYCGETLKADTTLPEFALKGRDSMAVDNYPIKAIIAPAK